MKAIVSIILSTLILLISSGLAYAKHFCGGHEMLSEITLGEAHLSCGMKMEASACGDELQDSHSCCSNKYLQVTTDDTFSKVDFDFNFDTQWFATLVTIFVLQEQILPESQNFCYKDYNPPPIQQDLQVLYETFLI
ncbi:MAG: hypothetical protein CL596_08910 [Alteromonas sp.]|nr:hypothetical protein [Alteromonas sp.]MAY21747.1 hypothetical protein [Flavobacteriaceae bacterium]